MAGVVWIGLRDGGIRLEVFLDREELGLDLALGLGAGLGLLGAWELGRRVLPRARELEDAFVELLGNLEPGDAFVLALISGFAEELFFRGALQESIGGVLGLAVATTLFALLHTGPGPAFRLWTLFAAAAGLLFGGLVLWRGNLLAAVLAHSLVNGVNLTRMAMRAGKGRGDRATGDH